MKIQNFIQSRFCFYSAHECLLQKELMDLELVSGSKTEKKTSRHCYNNFQQNWDFKCNKIRLCRQRQMLNYITPAFPGELFFHMEAVATLYPKVMDYLDLTTPYEVISGSVLGENALPEPNGWFPRVIHGYQLISARAPFTWILWSSIIGGSRVACHSVFPPGSHYANGTGRARGQLNYCTPIM